MDHAIWGNNGEIRMNPLDQVTGSPLFFLPSIDVFIMISIN